MRSGYRSIEQRAQRSGILGLKLVVEDWQASYGYTAVLVQLRGNLTASSTRRRLGGMGMGN